MNEQPSRPGAGRVIAEYCALHFGVPPASLWGRGKRRAVTDARNAAYFVISVELGWSFTRIGRLFGRDHTTVGSGIRRVMATVAPEQRDELVRLAREHVLKLVASGQAMHADGLAQALDSIEEAGRKIFAATERLQRDIEKARAGLWRAYASRGGGGAP